MNKVIYIYFGDDLFQKLNEFPDLNSSFSAKYKKCKVFNSLESTPDTTIDDLFLGWSYVICRIGSTYNHVGFTNSRNNLTRIFEDSNESDLIVSCCANEVFAASNDGKLFHYSTQNPKETSGASIEQNIRKIVTGDFQTLILLDDGSVSCLNVRAESPLRALHLPCPVVEVACGKEHVILLTHSGQVFTYGSGSHGQLGHGSIEKQEKPVLVEALDGIVMKAVACGGWHSAAVSDCGDLYMWGWNESGQLGLAEAATVCCLPQIVDLEEEKCVASVTCGSRHTAVLTEDFEVWSWGWNEYGQLGQPVCDKPCKIELPSGFWPQQVKCAFWSTLIAGIMK